MRKTNTMKSLKIKKDKITIEDTNASKKESQINEDLTDDFLAVGKSTADAVKNIAKTAKTVAKTTIKTLFSPISYLVTKWWKGESASMADFLKSVEKNLDEFSKDVDSLVKDWDNDNKKMMQAAGFSEQEANTFMLSISPPLGIANLLYDTINNNRSSSIDKASISNKNNTIELIVYFVAFFITGNDNSSDADVIRKIKSHIQTYIKNIFNEKTYKVLSDLHLKEKWRAHGSNLQAECQPITGKIRFKAAFSNPIEEIQRLHGMNLTSEIKKVTKAVKNYCNNNYNKKTESPIKTLNLKSKLIVEKIENVDEVSRIAFAISYMIFSNESTQEKMMQSVLANKFGDKATDLKKLLKARNDVKSIMQHLTMIYTNFVFCEFIMQVAEKLFENRNDNTYDFTNDINAINNKIKSDYFQGVPSEYSGLVTKINNKIEDVIQNSFQKQDFKDKPLVNITAMLDGLLVGSDALTNLPEFNYDVYKDGALFNKLEKTNFLAKADEDFWRFIREKSGINNIKNRAKEQLNVIKDYIEQQDAGSGTGGTGGTGGTS